MTHNPLLDVPEIAKAVGVLHAIANDPRERELYEARVEQIRLEKARMSYARDKGLQEGAIQFARETLLRLGRLRFGAALPKRQNSSMRLMTSIVTVWPLVLTPRSGRTRQCD